MALPEHDEIAAQAQIAQRIRTEIKSQLMFGSEWGSLMEGDAKPGATIEDEIARKKAQLRKLKQEYAKRMRRLQAAQTATAEAAADDDGDLDDALVERLAQTNLTSEAQTGMAASGARMSTLERFKPVADPKKDFRRVQKRRAAELGI